MSNGACILAHFADQEKLIPAATKLTANSAIARWDAVDGHVHVVAWSADSKQAREVIAALDGVDQVTAYEIIQPVLLTPLLDQSRCYAYVFIETEKSKTDLVSQALTAMPEVVSCSAVRDRGDLIVVVSGETFSRVDTAIRERVQPLIGVLRLKQNRIIDLKQL